MVLGDDDQLVDGRSLAVDVPTDDNPCPSGYEWSRDDRGGSASGCELVANLCTVAKQALAYLSAEVYFIHFSLFYTENP